MTIIKTKHIMQAALIATLLTLFFAGGCGSVAVNTASTDKTSPARELSETPKAAEKATPEGGVTAPSNERIGFITQEYYGDNIVEIPYFEYEGETNPEIESINRLLNQGLQFSYEEFLDNKQEHEWIEIKSYPFTTDGYLQVVITKSICPNYGTDGEMQSINYDRNAKKWLTTEDALEMMGLSEDDVMAGVRENFVPEIKGETIGALEIAGFLIHDVTGDGQIELLLNVMVSSPEADGKWSGFFAYFPDDNPNTNDLIRLNSYCLFDPYNMDETNPPLWYRQNLPGDSSGQNAEGMSERQAGV